MEHANATYFPSQNENNCNGNPDKMDKQKLHYSVVTGEKYPKNQMGWKPTKTLSNWGMHEMQNKTNEKNLRLTEHARNTI